MMSMWLEQPSYQRRPALHDQERPAAGDQPLEHAAPEKLGTASWVREPDVYRDSSNRKSAGPRIGVPECVLLSERVDRED